MTALLRVCNVKHPFLYSYLFCSLGWCFLEISEGDPNSDFQINTGTGKIETAKNIAYSSSPFDLRTTATDTAGLVTTGTVVVTLKTGAGKWYLMLFSCCVLYVFSKMKKVKSYRQGISLIYHWNYHDHI